MDRHEAVDRDMMVMVHALAVAPVEVVVVVAAAAVVGMAWVTDIVAAGHGWDLHG